MGLDAGGVGGDDSSGEALSYDGPDRGRPNGSMPTPTPIHQMIGPIGLIGLIGNPCLEATHDGARLFGRGLATEGTEFTERILLLPLTGQPPLQAGCFQMGKELRL